MKKRVLILCTSNSARSQMAEGLLRHFGGANYEVHSAGTYPSTVNPFAIEVMREIGVDISSHRSKRAAEFSNQQFDTVITVCDSAAKECPVFPGSAECIHWSLPDPAVVAGSHETKLAAFRRVRDELAKRLGEFLS